jgi:hypothetical protein
MERILIKKWFNSVISVVILTIVLCAWSRDERISEAEDPIEASQCHNFWDKILKSFSLQNNYKTLMDDTIPPNSISVINGIKYAINRSRITQVIKLNFISRSLSCFFILCFHMLWFSFYVTSNPGVLFHFSEKIRFQWLANAALMVDSFFCIRWGLMKGR